MDRWRFLTRRNINWATTFWSIGRPMRLPNQSEVQELFSQFRYYLCQVNADDNHTGYIGFRNSTNASLLAYDGAVNVVVNQWNSEG